MSNFNQTEEEYAAAEKLRTPTNRVSVPTYAASDTTGPNSMNIISPTPPETVIAAGVVAWRWRYSLDEPWSISGHLPSRATFVEPLYPDPEATISSLHSEIEKLREALTPFAATAEVDIGESETDEDIFQQASHNRAPKITVGDFRRASAAFAKETEMPA